MPKKVAGNPDGKVDDTDKVDGKAETVDELKKIIAIQDSKIQELNTSLIDVKNGMKAMIDQFSPLLRAMSDAQKKPVVDTKGLPDQKGADGLMNLVGLLQPFVQPQDKSGAIFYQLGQQMFANLVQNQQLNNKLMEALVNRMMGNVAKDITEVGMKE